MKETDFLQSICSGMSASDGFHIPTHDGLKLFLKDCKFPHYFILRHWILRDINHTLMKEAAESERGCVIYEKNEIPQRFVSLSHRYDEVLINIRDFFIELGYDADYKDDELTIWFDQTCYAKQIAEQTAGN